MPLFLQLFPAKVAGGWGTVGESALGSVSLLEAGSAGELLGSLQQGLISSVWVARETPRRKFELFLLSPPCF